MNRRAFLNASLGASFSGTLAPHVFSRTAAGPIEKFRPPNDQIREARETALDHLRPSPRELERGLRLHAESLVFDSYGFAPRAAVDGDRLRQAHQEGASDLELQDLREDMVMTRMADDPVELQEFRNAWKASGVTCIFQNAGEEGQDPLRLINRLARFTYLTDRLPDTVARAVTPEQVEEAWRGDRHCLYFSGNGVPLTQQWVSVPDELRYVRIFFQLGIRMMHLTYNRRNMIGDGCAEPSDAGLSDFGRAVVAELNRVGVIPDIAHSGWRTSLEAARVSAKPVVASHSTCADLYEHFRGKPDEVIRALADSGGYIGICCIPRFLGGGGDIRRLLDHVDHVGRRFGTDYVAIGTDVAYVPERDAQERRKLPAPRAARTRWAALWPPDPFETTREQRLSVSWTNWPLFTVGLVQRGYSEEDIRKILGGNVLRVLRATRAA